MAHTLSLWSSTRFVSSHYYSHSLYYFRRAFASSSSTPLPLGEVAAVVVGGGAVGLAVARCLAMSPAINTDEGVVLLESESHVGTATSSRNSEVIHAGIYYPANSSKNRMCHRGRGLLYDYLAERGIAHDKVGKLIVAPDERDDERLRELFEGASARGAPDLEMLTPAQARAMEPALRCDGGAIHSPHTGIFDSHAYMSALHADVENSGGVVVTNTHVLGGQVRPDGEGFTLRAVDVESGDQTMVSARYLVNAAGLHAMEIHDAIAAPLKYAPELQPGRVRYAKGSYFALKGGRSACPFRRLIYPLPEIGGLGVHLTLDLGGQPRFGPDVEFLPGEPSSFDDLYDVSASRAPDFERAIRAYWPEMPSGMLEPSYAGIRAKLPSGDFGVFGPDEHGVDGLVHILGIESPGLTSSLALAEDVVAKLTTVR